MLLPFNREALREKNRRDDLDAARQNAALTPSQRLEQALDLSTVVRQLAVSVNASWLRPPDDDLERKARRYPLRLLR